MNTSDSLLRHKMLENVSPSCTAPKAEGKERNGKVWVRSRSVFGCPESGAVPCKDNGEAVVCAEKDGEEEKNGCQKEERDGRYLSIPSTLASS
jgi:hypothetical protein